MSKWVLDDYAGLTLDYASLGFRASVGNILSATAAPDARWSLNGDQGAAETVTRYTLGIVDPNYVEPGDGHFLAWSDAANAYLPTDPSAVPVGDAAIASRINATSSATDVALRAKYVQITHRPINILNYATPGATNQTTQVQAAVDATPTAGTLEVPTGVQLRVDGQINVAKAMTLFSPGRGGFYSGVSSATTQKMFNVTVSDVSLRGLKLSGPQYAVGTAQYAVWVTGTSGTSVINNIRVVDCGIDNWGSYALNAYYVTGFQFDRNDIQHVGYAGVGATSCLNGSISGNRIDSVIMASGFVNSYGIYMDRKPTSSMSTDPRSANIACNGNVITNVPSWAGIDTHGGQNLSISGNTVAGCRMPISMVSSKNAGGFTVYAPLDVSIVGNTVTSGVTDGSQNSMHIIGNATELATGIISGNIVRGHGFENSGSSGGIQAEYTRGITISGNAVFEPSPIGIYLGETNTNFVLSGNTITDPWSTSLVTKGVYVGGSNNSGFIGGNTLSTGSKTATKTNANGLGIGVANNSGNAVQLGPNLASAAATPYYDPGSKTATQFGDKPTVTGSRGSNAALTSLLSALAAKGILTDSSS